MPRHNTRVAAPKPLADKADLAHFQGGIIHFLWRYELSHAQRSVFVAVIPLPAHPYVFMDGGAPGRAPGGAPARQRAAPVLPHGCERRCVRAYPRP